MTAPPLLGPPRSPNVEPLIALVRTAPTREDLDGIIFDADYQATARALTDPERKQLRAAIRHRRGELPTTTATQAGGVLPSPPAATSHTPGRRGDLTPGPAPRPQRARAGFYRLAWRPAAYRDPDGALVIDGRTYAESPFRAATARTAPPRAILDALPPHTRRVFLCGPRPGGDTAAGMRAWFTSWLTEPGAWTAEPPEWRDNDRNPVLRVARQLPDGSVQRVELRRIEEWFGEDVGAGDANAAMRALTEALRLGFGDEHAIPVASPATTGMQLWRRTHPTERFDPLPAELRELVRSTAGQGRQELLAVDSLTRAPFCYLDARLAYAALCWGLPDAGEVVVDQVPTFAGQRRGRYLVEFRVPRGWAHVGLLGVRREDRWAYPSKPGEKGTTWCDGAELQLALERGWPVKIKHRLLFADGPDARRPLDTWSRKLVEIRAGISRRVGRGQLTPEIGELVEQGLRAILLHGIGRFGSAARDVVRYVASPEELAGIPRERIVAEEPVGDGRWRVTISEDRTDDWSRNFEHPEWSAAVWARQRRRLLDGPQQTGVLHVPRADVLGVYVDAIYLTHNPHWPDDGKPGRFRIKGESTGKIAVPRSWEALFKAARKCRV